MRRWREGYLGTPVTAPGPNGPAMLGRMREIRRDPLAFLVDVHAQYGDVVQFPIPRPPTYLVSDPFAVRRVLVTNARNYGKDTVQYRSLRLVTGEGLLAADTAAWRTRRPIVQPAFARRSLDQVVGDTRVAARELFRAWDAAADNGASVDVAPAIARVTLEVVGKSLFGSGLGADAARLDAAIAEATEVVVARARLPLRQPSWLPTPSNIALTRSLARLDGLVRRLVDGRRATTDPAPDDLLSLLMRAEADRQLHLRSVRDEIVTFLVAGHETVATALTWAVGMVAARPELQERLRAEHDASSPPLARAVIDETLRIYPPAWLITRSALDDDELAGHAIPKGALVIVSPWIVHRHASAWERPDEFLPDRDFGADRAAFIPFGAGPRLCIGRDFAYAETTTLISAIAARYRLEPVGSVPLPAPGVTVKPARPITVRIGQVNG